MLEHSPGTTAWPEEPGMDAIADRLDRLENEAAHLHELERAVTALTGAVAKLTRDNAVLQCSVSILERRLRSRPAAPHHPH